MPEPPRLPDPGAMPDPAALQVTESTRTYPCPQCGANLGYDPSVNALKCASCGHTQSVMVDQTPIANHDMNEAAAFTAALAAAPQTSLTREIVCQNCGGHTRFDGTWTATRCPYCNTPIQRDDLKLAPGRLPVDGILPLRIPEAEGRRGVEEWIDSRWFAPNAFKKYRELGSFSSVYLTYFAYDADTTTNYTGQRGDNYTEWVERDGRRVAETRTNWSYASGTVTNQFVDLPAIANRGFDPAKVMALEPWPVEEAVPYTQAFVAGHLSRTYDVGVAETFESEVKSRIDAEIDRTIRSDIGGDQQRVSSADTTYQRLDYTQLLMPTWLLTVTYKSQPFQVLINGITGEVQGDRPYSAVKIFLLVMVITIIVVALVVYFGGR